MWVYVGYRFFLTVGRFLRVCRVPVVIATTSRTQSIKERGRGLGRASSSEAAVLDRIVRSLTLCPTVVPLVEDRLLQVEIFAVGLDGGIDSKLDMQRIGGISGVFRWDWHDLLLTTAVVPVERVVGTVTGHPDPLVDGERGTCDAHRYLLGRLYALGEQRINRISEEVETIVPP